MLKNSLGERFALKVGDESDIQVETIFLKKLSSYDWCPNFIFEDKNYVLMEYVEGVFLEDYIKSSLKSECVRVLDICLKICLELDKLGITKKEFLRPLKHVIISDNGSRVVFIDYERALYSDNAKNTRQFLEYIRRKKDFLATKDIRVDERKIMDFSKNMVNVIDSKSEKLAGYKVLSICDFI